MFSLLGFALSWLLYGHSSDSSSAVSLAWGQGSVRAAVVVGLRTQRSAFSGQTLKQLSFWFAVHHQSYTMHKEMRGFSSWHSAGCLATAREGGEQTPDLRKRNKCFPPVCSRCRPKDFICPNRVHSPISSKKSHLGLAELREEVSSLREADT